MLLSRRNEHRSGGPWPFPGLRRWLPLKETRGLSHTKFRRMGGLPLFHDFLDCLHRKGTRGGMAPLRGRGSVTWGASPSFVEDLNACVWPCAPSTSPGEGRTDTIQEPPARAQATR